MKSRKSLLALAILTTFLSGPLYALPLNCRAQLGTEALRQELLSRPYNRSQKGAFDKYIALKTARPELEGLLPERFVNTVVMDSLAPAYSEVLQQVLIKLEVKEGAITEIQVKEALRELLTDTVPAHQVEARIEKFFRRKTSANLELVLGKMTLKEVQETIYGNDPLNPSPESLIGRYLQETGAAKVRRSFSKGPEHPNEQGSERLVVAVSADSFGVFSKYFAKINYLLHIHTPGQGTLMLGHNGRAGTYGSHFTETHPQYINMEPAQIQVAIDGSTLRFPGLGTIMPTILLSTSEGNRAQNFFKLASVDANSARHPWTLKDAQNNPYCAMGGYNSCTHWFGNIPVGDKTTNSYTLPGKIDQHAYNNVPVGAQEKPLVAYTNTNDLIRLVWTVPGQEQLHTVLGLQAQQVAGELANPGYVAVSLTSQTPVERMPVVFLAVQDHRTPISPDFNPQIRAY